MVVEDLQPREGRNTERRVAAARNDEGGDGQADVDPGGYAGVGAML